VVAEAAAAAAGPARPMDSTDYDRLWRNNRRVWSAGAERPAGEV
jgi:hypothetical protein